MTTSPSVDALVQQLENHPGVTLHLDASVAFAFAGALQLACRHPAVDGKLKEQLVDVINRIADGMGGPVAAAIPAGWDPEQDR